MPLDLGALEIIQQLKVFSCLDPLGNDLQLKALGELDSGAGNSGIVGIGRNIPHKGLGNLQYVNSIRLKYSREEQPVLKSSIESLIPMAFNAMLNNNLI